MLAAVILAMTSCIIQLRAPVPSAVVRGFVPPPCTYCAGHRGVVFGEAGRIAVRSPTTGVVTFEGSAFGVLYVVVSPRAGVKVTVGRLMSLAPRVEGQWVEAGEVLGIAGSSTYLGVRIGDQPADPMALMARRGAILSERGRSRGKSLACGAAENAPAPAR